LKARLNQGWGLDDEVVRHLRGTKSSIEALYPLHNGTGKIESAAALGGELKRVPYAQRAGAAVPQFTIAPANQTIGPILIPYQKPRGVRIPLPVDYGETSAAVILFCCLIYSLQKGIAVRRHLSVALVAQTFEAVNLLDAARHHGETGSRQTRSKSLRSSMT
jgi:hypothetical protein